jgi:hypothetical protein
MRKIVDSNYLNNPALVDYLSASQTNFVVLCDYAAIEAYKAKSPVKSILASMEILADFPKQVIVLKNTVSINKLKLAEAGAQRRMIDDSLTKGFPLYCRQLSEVRGGSDFYAAQLRDHGLAAAAHADKSLDVAKDIHETVLELAKDFTGKQLTQLRSSKLWDEDLASKVREQLLVIVAHAHIAANLDIRKIEFSSLLYSLIFRYAMCCYLMALRWIINGAPPKNPEKLRNHVFDCGFVAYATFFDGLLTRDEEALVTYSQATLMLKRLINN